MKILFITEDDPLYVIRFFERFFDIVDREKLHVSGITISRAFHEPLWKTAQRMLRFYGLVGFLRLSARFATAKLSGTSIERLAEENKIPILETDSVNADSYLSDVRKLAPDVIVSVAAPEIFKSDLLAAAKLMCINIHSGRLPVYRGMMPVFWQMMKGEKSVTVTVHEMAKQLDAGAVLGTRQFPIREKDTLDRMITVTKLGGAELMHETLLSLDKGELIPQPLDLSNKEYFSFPTKKDVRALHQQQHRLL